MKFRHTHAALLLLAVAALVVGDPHLAHAATSNLPWDGPLQTIRDDLTGPTAGYLALIAIFGTGARLIFGGEMGEFTKGMVYLILVVAVILGAGRLITIFGTTNGAVLPW